jgi:N-acetylmuramoyl-L-alanine amidase
LLTQCVAHTALASAIRITDFRFFSEASKIRLVFDANGPINYTVQEPRDQIVINIKDARLIALLNKTWLYKTPISSVKGEVLGKNLRLVLNLKRPTKLQHFVLQKPYRLVLDLAGSNVVLAKNPIATPAAVTNHQEPFPIPTAIVDNSQSNRNYDFNNKNLREVVVVIDPGHGGEDPGAVGIKGTREKDVAFAVARILQKAINQVKGFRAVLTRNGDYFITLRQRLNIAHRNKADMFIAIHADACTYIRPHGVSVFALSQRGATSEAARWLAEKENASELGQTISDKNELLRSVLIDLAQAATISASLEIGDDILQKLSHIAYLHSSSIEQAAFVVLKSPDIPSLLIETGFISDPHEEKKLRDARYQQKIATCLASGIVTYFMHRPPQGTYLAKAKQRSF